MEGNFKKRLTYFVLRFAAADERLNGL